MGEELRYRRDVRLPFQEIQGEAVVVVPSRRESHRFDETGTFLWTALAKERSVADLVAALCDEFEVDAVAAEQDVREFVASLESKGLVLRS